jgi:hypothetical protein
MTKETREQLIEEVKNAEAFNWLDDRINSANSVVEYALFGMIEDKANFATNDEFGAFSAGLEELEVENGKSIEDEVVDYIKICAENFNEYDKIRDEIQVYDTTEASYLDQKEKGVKCVAEFLNKLEIENTDLYRKIEEKQEELFEEAIAKNVEEAIDYLKENSGPGM